MEFYRGVPGSVGGALVMNAGCYGAETADVLVEARAVTRDGRILITGGAGFLGSHLCDKLGYIRLLIFFCQYLLL